MRTRNQTKNSEKNSNNTMGINQKKDQQGKNYLVWIMKSN